MKTLTKVVEVNRDYIKFDNVSLLKSEHESDCCESHYLSFVDLNIEDFEGLEFDLTNDNFFKRIKDYGIELIPVHGFPVKIAGYAYNNGYYSDTLELTLSNSFGIIKKFDITECQDYPDEIK